MAPEEGESAGRAFDVVKGDAPKTPILETARFMMRPLVREDAAALFPTLSDPENCKFLLRAPFETIGELGDWLCDPDWNGRTWSAIDKETQELAARVVAVPAADQVTEIGYITAVNRSGEGIASECTARLVEYLFEEEGYHRLTAGTDPRNEASNAILRKLGFRLEAHLRESVKTHMGWCDEYLWGLLASEWNER